MLTLLVILAITIVATPVLALFMAQKPFGRMPSGDRKVRIENSPFYRDGILENEIPTRIGSSDESMPVVLWKFLTRKKAARLIPGEGEIPVVKSDLKRLSVEGDCLVWFGHSSFLMQLGGKTLLFDPVFYKASPVSFVNRPFKGTDIYKLSDLPERIDYLVISHDHWDHLDYRTVRELKDRVGKVVCPLGVGEDFVYWGYREAQLIELDCNENATDGAFVFHCLPTRHFSGRGFRSMRTQRASWLVDAPSRRIFYSGDGGYSDRFSRYGAAFPGIDLAILENGQYNQDWRDIHMMPEYLGQAVKALQPQRFMTMHHSKYALANHDWDEPRRNEKAAAEVSGVPLVVVQIGEVVPL
ncbi:MAG: MBL fold metallo-hydrolase [Bacteroidales bacterium]|nr:MBL fold metallo-hydrolase [Bacteroidales bacterium]